MESKALLAEKKLEFFSIVCKVLRNFEKKLKKNVLIFCTLYACEALETAS